VSAPRVPLRCAGRPLVGGFVVPWITLVHDGRAHFGRLDENRRRRALRERLCQVCGERLEDRVCLAVRPADVEVGYTPEPGLHPECLAYSVRACPMLNGQMAHYRRAAGAALPATAQAVAPSAPQGHPADAFDAWWIAPSSYRVKPDPKRPGHLLGLDLDVPVLRMRPIRAAAPSTPTADQLLELLRQALALEEPAPDTEPEPDQDVTT
jgi:hypothetical protein